MIATGRIVPIELTMTQGQPPTITQQSRPAPEPPKGEMQSLFWRGGLAIALMLAVLVAAAVWSTNRRLRRIQTLKADTARRKGQDPWAAAGERVVPLSNEQLESQFSPPSRPRREGNPPPAEGQDE